MWVRIVYNIVEYFDSATIAHPLTDTVLMKVLLFRTQFQFIRNLKNLHSGVMFFRQKFVLRGFGCFLKIVDICWLWEMIIP